MRYSKISYILPAVLSFTLAGCLDYATDSVDVKQSAGSNSTTGSAVIRLGICDSENEGETFYITETSQLFTCTKGFWAINVSATVSASNCNANTEGNVKYSEETDTHYQCLSGVWTAQVTDVKSSSSAEILEEIPVEGSSDEVEFVSSNRFTDVRDGQTYKFVTIGKQVWMAENLNYSVDGSSWCAGDKSDNCKSHGSLYNWKTALTVCPAGWHLPSNEEYETLWAYVDANNGDESVETSLKATAGWDEPGSDRFGFAALPAGFYWSGANDFGADAGFWSSGEDNYNQGYDWRLYHGSNYDQLGMPKEVGFAVRCVYDEAVAPVEVSSSSVVVPTSSETVPVSSIFEVVSSSSAKSSLSCKINTVPYMTENTDKAWFSYTVNAEDTTQKYSAFAVNQDGKSKKVSSSVYGKAVKNLNTKGMFYAGDVVSIKVTLAGDTILCGSYNIVDTDLRKTSVAAIGRYFSCEGKEFKKDKSYEIQVESNIKDCGYKGMTLSLENGFEWDSKYSRNGVGNCAATITASKTSLVNVIDYSIRTNSTDGEDPYVKIVGCREISEESNSPEPSSSTENVVFGKYDCDSYNCVTTKFLNQQMLAEGKYGELLDTRDNQVYRTIKIGKQTWMAQNLNYESNGSSCWNKDESYCKKYGRLYPMEVARSAASSKGVVQGSCPMNWHIPSDAEFRTLLQYVGGERMENVRTEISSWPTYYSFEHSGKSLKSMNSDWDVEGDGDRYGFSATLTGNRWDFGSFDNMLSVKRAQYWTVTEETDAWNRLVTWTVSDEQDYGRLHYDCDGYLFAIRCVKDEEETAVVSVQSSSSSVAMENPNEKEYATECGGAASCWILELKAGSTMSLDIANYISKVPDYYIENLETGWKQVNGTSGNYDCPGWTDVPTDGVYRLTVNNWSNYMPDKEGKDEMLLWMNEVRGSIIAMDMWGKTYWDVTMEEVYGLPTTIYNCENLEVPPRYTSSVKGELIPYIKAMHNACPKVRGNSSLAQTTNAADFVQAKRLYPEWF